MFDLDPAVYIAISTSLASLVLGAVWGTILGLRLARADSRGPFCPYLSEGVALIARERTRQVLQEGFTAVKDDMYLRNELTTAAACYALARGRTDLPQLRWPWDMRWWKPCDDPTRNLAKAGALLAAEIDRIQRHRPAANPPAVDVVPPS